MVVRHDYRGCRVSGQRRPIDAERISFRIGNTVQIIARFQIVEVKRIFRNRIERLRNHFRSFRRRHIIQSVRGAIRGIVSACLRLALEEANVCNTRFRVGGVSYKQAYIRYIIRSHTRKAVCHRINFQVPGIVCRHIGRSKRSWLSPRQSAVGCDVMIVSDKRGIGCAGIFHRHISVLAGNADPCKRNPRIAPFRDHADIFSAGGCRDFDVVPRYGGLRHHINVRVVIRFLGRKRKAAREQACGDR